MRVLELRRAAVNFRETTTTFMRVMRRRRSFDDVRFVLSECGRFVTIY
jgi:hypothetical protein